MEILRQCQGPLDAIFVAVGGGGLIAGIAAYVKRVRPGGEDHRRAAGRLGRDGALARSAGRRVMLPHVGPVRRRRGGQAGRQGDVPARARATSTRCARRHRRDLRRDQGRLRGHALDPRARRRALDRRRQGVGRAAPHEGPHVRRDRLRREHELRPAALRRRARRARRAARGDPRGDDPRAAGQLPRVLRAARQAQRSPSSTTATPTRRSRTSSSASRSPDRHETDRAARASCKRHRIEAYDLSDNEMAKLHVRHLVGGHAPAAENEILYRFEFPERPGRADALPRQHERAAGTSACSTTATTAPTTGACWSECRSRRRTRPSSGAFSTGSGYDYVDETGNPAYRMFLGR